MYLHEQKEAVVTRIIEAYPDRRPFLSFQSCFELLIAVILSAQTLDSRVNEVTPVLFRLFPGPEELSKASLDVLENLIRPVGFYRVKSKHIKEAATIVATSFRGKVPEAMEDLLSIPGVGRKSAHVIRAHCFRKPAIIVDTHFTRVTRRLHLVASEDPLGIEREIEAFLPEPLWTDFSMSANRHGRDCCFARKPDCSHCPVLPFCPSAKSDKDSALYLKNGRESLR